ncbi:MAG: alkaline phosphatase family protein [Planctomycetota bacterium]
MTTRLRSCSDQSCRQQSCRKQPLLLTLLVLFLTGWRAGEVGAEPPRTTKNVIVVTLDGFRRQELFTGADSALFDANFGGVKNVAGLRAEFWRETPEARREALLPFFWKTIAVSGQVFGDPEREATTTSTNGLKFSYPGYSELFCGVADPRIASNDKVDNPNLSVLEFLASRPGFERRVAAFCTWDVFPSIFRSKKNGLPVHAGWVPLADEPLTVRQQSINEMIQRLPRYWPNNSFDAITMEAAKEHLQRHQPRVLYIGLGETDEWAHGRRYDLYLESARKADRFLQELWNWLQAHDQYRNQTTLIVTTDHGRGAQRENWTDHGKNIATAEFIWIGLLGPDVKALGVRQSLPTTQSQVAATIAAALGENIQAAVPAAAPPLKLE